MTASGTRRVYPGGVELPFEERTLPRLLERQAERHGERPLLRFPGGERSYAGTRDAAARFAGRLAAAGVRPGDRVALMCGNRGELLDIVLGCAWLGAIAVPLNTALRGAQLEHVLGNADPRILVFESTLVRHLELVGAPPPALERIWVVGEAAEPRWADVPQSPFPDPGDPADPHPVRPGDTFAILYTSGTTGPAKGVCCPHAQFYWWGRLTAGHLAVSERDVLYSVLPLFHTNALNTVFQALLTGSTYAVGARFSASGFWRELRESGATVTYLLGTMAHILLDRPPSPGDTAHRTRIALSPATPAGLATRFAERFGVHLVDGYGSTETNFVLCNTIGGHVPGSLGRVVDGFEATVVDAEDVEVPAGTPGELIVRHREPFSIATGYFRMPEETAAAWRNLWFHTGDRVVREPDGVFHFLDRRQDAIRRRGENISSWEVEQALLGHDDVALAAVVPVPSGLGDDEVLAFVVPREGARPDPIELVRHCESRLAYFAIPRYLELVPDLPLTGNGKVRKRLLRERGLGDATWDREAAGYVITR
ncbi:MAG: AMP-binding protein [Actinobacteria bacterium]|nr:AMP-binding protein [Actinomycetota bacterium]